MASKGLFRDVDELRKAKEMAAKKRRLSNPMYGTGEMLKESESTDVIRNLTKMPGDFDEIPMRRPEEPAQEIAAAGSGDKPRMMAKDKAKKKKSPSTDKLQAGLALAGQAGGGLGNIASGAASGAAFGPPGMIAGAALGGLKNLAAQSQKRKKLKAQAILGQGAAAEKASRGEREALENIMIGLREALIF